jgi:hypothetical protein
MIPRGSERFLFNKGNNKITEFRTIFRTNINGQNQSTTGKRMFERKKNKKKNNAYKTQKTKE